jgi:hypothetical protein
MSHIFEANVLKVFSGVAFVSQLAEVISLGPAQVSVP